MYKKIYQVIGSKKEILCECLYTDNGNLLEYTNLTDDGADVLGIDQYPMEDKVNDKVSKAG